MHSWVKLICIRITYYIKVNIACMLQVENIKGSDLLEDLGIKGNILQE
jgi:hypothetical protein